MATPNSFSKAQMGHLAKFADRPLEFANIPSIKEFFEAKRAEALAHYELTQTETAKERWETLKGICASEAYPIGTTWTVSFKPKSVVYKRRFRNYAEAARAYAVQGKGERTITMDMPPHQPRMVKFDGTPLLDDVPTATKWRPKKYRD